MAYLEAVLDVMWMVPKVRRMSESANLCDDAKIGARQEVMSVRYVLALCMKKMIRHDKMEDRQIKEGRRRCDFP